MRTLTTRTKWWTMMMIRMNTPFNMIHFRGGGGGTGGEGIDDVIADGLTPPVGHTPLINRQQRSRPALHKPVLQQDQRTSNGIIPGMASCFLIAPRVRHIKMCCYKFKRNKLCIPLQDRSQNFLRGGAIQRGDGPNEAGEGPGSRYRCVWDCISSVLKNCLFLKLLIFKSFFPNRVLYFTIF